MEVTALYVRRDSVYKTLGVDCWDADRDARKWKGGNALIAHPPCRAWGRLKHFAKPREDEKELALHAVKMIRKFGGVLEHPSRSTLWDAVPLPMPGERDDFGGFTISINQSWFGHRAEKKTFLYICGIEPKELPDYPISFDAVTHVIASSKNKRLSRDKRPEVSKAEREHTPEPLATWLVDLCKLINENKCKKGKKRNAANVTLNSGRTEYKQRARHNVPGNGRKRGKN